MDEAVVGGRFEAQRFEEGEILETCKAGKDVMPAPAARRAQVCAYRSQDQARVFDALIQGQYAGPDALIGSVMFIGFTRRVQASGYAGGSRLPAQKSRR